jgi:hypothetical protein
MSCKWYHTQRWRRRATLQLKQYRFAQFILQNGQVVPATDAIISYHGLLTQASGQ